MLPFDDFFLDFFDSSFQGEEPVDKLPELTEACKPKCTAEWAKYEVRVAYVLSFCIIY